MKIIQMHEIHITRWCNDASKKFSPSSSFRMCLLSWNKRRHENGKRNFIEWEKVAQKFTSLTCFFWRMFKFYLLCKMLHRLFF